MSNNGKFVWHEFFAKDTEAALAFYTEAIGWKTVTEEMAMGPYHLLAVDEKGIGGVMPLPETAAKAGLPAHWVGYVATADLDGVTERVAELGGKIVQGPFDVDGVGRIAILADPQGGALAIIQSANEDTLIDETVEGAFSWAELACDDPEAALEFYGELFGWVRTDSMQMGEAGTYQMFAYAEGERSRGGIFPRPQMMPQAAWVYYTNTNDLDAATARVERGGGKLLNGPNEVPGGRIAQYADPQGGVFALHAAS